MPIMSRKPLLHDSHVDASLGQVAQFDLVHVTQPVLDGPKPTMQVVHFVADEQSAQFFNVHLVQRELCR